MPTAFPTAPDVFSRPDPADPRVGHAQHHVDLADAVEAIEAAIGTPAVADPSSLSERIAVVESVSDSLGDAALLNVGTITGTVAAGDDARLSDARTPTAHAHVTSDVTGFAAAALAAAPAETTTTAGGLIAGATDKATPVDADSVGLSDSEAAGVLKKWSWADIKASITTALTGVFAKLSGVSGGQTLIGGTQAADGLTLQGTSATGTGTAVKVLCGTAGATEAVTVLESGYVGIGKADPGYPLEIGTTLRVLPSGVLCIGTPTGETVVLASGTNVRAVNTNLGITTTDDNTISRTLTTASHNITPTANVTQTRSAYVVEVVTDAATAYTYSQIRGCSFALEHLGGGLLTSATTANLSINVRGAGGITTARGSWQGVTQQAGSSGNISKARCAEYNIHRLDTATGTITTGVCVDAWIGNYSSSGKITTAIGIGIGDSTDPWYNSGTIDNAYAIHIGSSTNIGTNKKAIYSLSAAQSYMAGALAIGLDSTAAKLHSVATTTQLRLGYDAAKYADFVVNSTGQLKISAPLIITPPASITPATNGDLVIEATSNTSLTFRFKGSDGVVRSASLTIS